MNLTTRLSRFKSNTDLFRKSHLDLRCLHQRFTFTIGKFHHTYSLHDITIQIIRGTVVYAYNYKM